MSKPKQEVPWLLSKFLVRKKREGSIAMATGYELLPKLLTKMVGIFSNTDGEVKGLTVDKKNPKTHQILQYKGVGKDARGGYRYWAGHQIWTQ